MIDYLPKNIPRILINRTIVHPPENVNNDDDDGSECGIDFRESYVFDAYLLGYCDDVTRALRKRLFATSVGISLAQPLDEDTDVLGDLLSSFLRDAEYTSSAWSAVGVPPERVFLFPGSEAPTGVKEEIAFREIAHCDGCSKRIKGTIQKCIECFDFDLCHFCFPVLSTTHYEGQHHFIAETVAPF